MSIQWNIIQPQKELLLLLLSHFSRVRLCATPETAAHQDPQSLGFSRQEHWSGLPFPSPMHESEKWKWSRSVLSDSSYPMDYSPPGSSVHGIFQAKVLESDATAFSIKGAKYRHIYNMNEPWNIMLSERRKTQKDTYLYDFIYMKCPE